MSQSVIRETPFVWMQKCGPMDNFIYFLGDPETKRLAIIDPGWEAEFLLSKIDEYGYELESIILTHGHYDHVNAIPAILQKRPVPVYISAHEAPQLIPQVDGVALIEDGAVLKVGNVDVTCLHTPGHSPGGQCLLAGDVMFSGDTLFVMGCGRCDLPGSDPEKMYMSLYETLSVVGDNVEVLPGHDYGRSPTATMGWLRQNNPYLAARDRDDFLLRRMG